jgi:proline dehydrogenase
MGLSLCSGRIDKAKAKETCYRNIEAITRSAREKSRAAIGVIIDMEQSDTVDDTLDIHRSLRRDLDNIGTVLQASLYRTNEDIQNLADAQGRIRICIGVYQEPPDMAHQEKKFKKRALVSQAMEMLGLGYYVKIATHDTAVLDEAIMSAREKDIPFHNFEFQWLLGVRINSRKRNLFPSVRVGQRLGDVHIIVIGQSNFLVHLIFF